MTRAWRIRWEFFHRRLTTRGLARKYRVPVPAIERIIRSTPKRLPRG